MLDDFNSRIPVKGEASRVRAVLAGQATRPPDLYTSPFQMQAPRLDFIVGVQSLREGERIITSGDGGLYPRGIPVGVARASGDGQWRVALAASQRPIDFVRILPFVGIERPEETQVPDEGPPLTTTSSVAAVGRELTQARPVAPSAAPPQPRPRPAASAPTPQPVQREPAPPQTEPPAEPQPQTQPQPTEPQE
jgi:rod shape-determining protein MreC